MVTRKFIAMLFFLVVRMLAVTGTLTAAGCNWTVSSRPSFLIVAVENLNSEALDCASTDEDFQKGIVALCGDSIRFSHAYTPSVLSQPTLVSVLTGLYPFSHRVHHNGNQFLSEKIKTVSEVALEKGYRTSLISGGAPIWRKSGLAKGFEVFDDNVVLNNKKPYRSMARSIDMFFSWLKDTSDSKPFFSVIFAADLQFSAENVPGKLTTGQVRGGTDSQLHELNENVADLLARLKKINAWTNTNVILVGLNGGANRARSNELETINLDSENTRVFFLIKPARKNRDEVGTGWTIDTNVSLVDLGATLFDLLHARDERLDLDHSPEVVSLKSALEKPQVSWSNERLIPVESAWAQWRGVGEARYAIRKGHLLYMYDHTPHFYNSLTDRLELQPISPADTAVREAAVEITDFINIKNLTPYEPITTSLNEKLILAQQIFAGEGSPENQDEKLAHLTPQRPWDRQLVGWRARLAFRQRNWPLLAKIGEEQIYPAWTFIARRQLGESPEVPNDNCLLLVEKISKGRKPFGQCQDREFTSFVDWIQAGDSSKRGSAEEKFYRIYSLGKLDEEIIERNFQNGLPWDAAVDAPAEPHLVDLVLTLPEMKVYRQILEGRAKRSI